MAAKLSNKVGPPHNAQRNPFFIDILISVLIRKHGHSAKYVSEINDLFDVLERVGEEGGRSFFTTRKAEFEHLCGSNKEALKLIEIAVAKTPSLFEPRRLQAEIYLKDRNKIKALESINIMRNMTNTSNSNERRSNFRQYLETYSHYLAEVGKYDEAKKVYATRSIFTDEEQKEAIRNIEIVQGFNTR